MHSLYLWRDFLQQTNVGQNHEKSHWVISLTWQSLSRVCGQKGNCWIGESQYEDDPKISLSPKIWSTPFMVSWLPRIHVYPYYTSLGWEIIGVRYQRKIVHTVSQIARNPWSNTERGHLLEANWSNNFEFIQRLAKSLWILKDTEIKSPPNKVIALQ